ncbi:MAG TPA: F0F1 ATP synthase subunit gamma [Steroidobacteraceae bacterium]|nr:F0F1 ATP synthase subunit gamma [Steroidobacteraceae bacterium]
MRLAEIERHVASMEELQQIVGAMRAIASMRMQEAVRALSSVREYGTALVDALHDALAIASDETRVGGGDMRRLTDETGAPGQWRARRAIVLFASEHGFVGGFNQRLIETAESDLTATDALMIVGSRGAAFAAERGHAAAWSHPLATGLTGIPETVRLLEEALLPRISRAAVLRAEVIYGRYGRSGQLDIERRRLFPLELGPVRAERRGLAPLHDLPLPELLEKLTTEYMLAQLTEAATEALAAENAARFAAMDSARDNVGRKLDTLRLDASGARQEEITTELLDLVTGEQALS